MNELILLNELINNVPLTEFQRQQARVWLQAVQNRISNFDTKLEEAKKEHSDKIEELKRKIDAR